jgi:hypothetical protein
LPFVLAGLRLARRLLSVPDMFLRICVIGFSLVLAACAGSSAPQDTGCEGGKCDDPGSAANRECQEMCGSDQACFRQCREDKAYGFCADRRADAVASAQRALTIHHIRWACADVQGVNTNFRDDRGQEYCEYYAVVQPPPTEAGDLPPPVDLGRQSGFGTTPLSLDFDDEQIFALEDEPDAVVGQCIFTSWHQDVTSPLPSCEGGQCPEIAVSEDSRIASWMSGRGLGFPLDGEMGRMKISINSNGAADDLVQRCLEASEPPGVSDPDDERLRDDYVRGCMQSFALFGTEWRRSDPTICAASRRLAECGCGVDVTGDGVADITDRFEIARALVPSQPQFDEDGNPVITLRGFMLGTWSALGELPSGCRFLDTGDDSQVLVGCDLTASDILASMTDPKNRCREKYGDNVVVHIPVPADAVVCEPPPGGAHTASCGERPWIIGDEGGSGGGDSCCKVCRVGKACGNSCISRELTCHQDPGCACDAEDLELTRE